MSLTPVEIRHLQLSRTFLRGYRKGAVDQLLSDIADSFEEVWRERADLADQLDELETEASKHRELEALLRSTLVSAERAAHEMKEQARRESDLIVQEAHAEGRRITREVAAEKQRLEEDIRKIRAMLRTALESLDGGKPILDARGEAPQQQNQQPQQAPQQQPGLVEELRDSGVRRVAG
jgi:cell division initiation protein